MSSPAKRIVDYTIIDVISVIIVISVFSFVFRIASDILTNTDGTDMDRLHRSGVRVITDHATGREYLETPQGFLTPRLRSDTPVNVNNQYFSPVTASNGEEK